MRQKIIKAGPHSLSVVIPAGFKNALGIKKGDTVEVYPDSEKAKITLEFKGNLQQLVLPQANFLKSRHHKKN